MTTDVMAVFSHVHQKGTTVVFATHNTDLVRRYPYREIQILAGREDRGETAGERGPGINVFSSLFSYTDLPEHERQLVSHLGTICIIAISILIFSAFSLIAFNLTSLLKVWEDKIEVIAYLKGRTPPKNWTLS